MKFAEIYKKLIEDSSKFSNKRVSDRDYLILIIYIVVYLLFFGYPAVLDPALKSVLSSWLKNISWEGDGKRSFAIIISGERRHCSAVDLVLTRIVVSAI